MTLRYFDAGGLPATHVELVVSANQCTARGRTPVTRTTTRTPTPTVSPSPRANEVHATELQVFGEKAKVHDSKSEDE